MTDSAETVLPEPDSPTNAAVSPRPILNETDFTAWTTPPGCFEINRQVADVDQRLTCLSGMLIDRSSADQVHRAPLRR